VAGAGVVNYRVHDFELVWRLILVRRLILDRTFIVNNDVGKKVFLILDNLRVHHSNPVKAWAAERQERIELFYLPSYSPKLNPEEPQCRPQTRHRDKSAGTKAKLKLAATEHMLKLEKSPERVKSFFQDPCVKYAD
jgi:hypothetical protein